MIRAGLLGVWPGLLMFLSACPSFHSGPMPNPPRGATFVEVDNVRVRYVARGEGPAVVLIHGYGSQADIWQPVAKKLAVSHRVIAVDLKGFGWSSRPAGDYSPQAQAALVWSVLDRLGVRDVAVVGHSWGASVALAMTLQSPRRVRRIALYSAYVYEDQVPSFLRWARIGGIGEMLFTLYYRERIEERVALAYHDDAYVTQEAFDRVRLELGRPGAVAAALAAARGQRYVEVEKRYPSIVQPVLMLWGREDLVTPISYGERLLRELPNAELVVLPRCGHLPMIEAKNPSTRRLVSFLAEDIE